MNGETALHKLPLDRIVDNRTYTDPAVFDAEQERIFATTWSFACHESEVATAGDFVTFTLAGSSVVVVRGNDDQLRAFYNTCRHRGALVVDEERGSTSALRCPYHSWVYSTDGTLVGIPGEEAYDGTGFCKEEFPLVQLRCESVLGLVFVNASPDAMSLAEWLGDPIVEVLQTPLANADFTVFQHSATELPINWKVYAENIRDGYHVPFVHPFFRKASPPGRYSLHPNWHAVQELGMDPAGIDPDLWEQLQRDPLPGVSVGEGYIVNVFPDLAITLRSNVVSIDSQRALGTDRVVLENRTLGLLSDDEATLKTRAVSQRTWFADPVLNEDVPIFLRQQRGVASRGLRYSVIARGSDATEGSRGDDNRLRQFWVGWRSLMGVPANSLDGALSDSDRSA